MTVRSIRQYFENVTDVFTLFLGALTVRPKGEGNIKPPIQDAIKITAAALGRLNKDGTSLTSPPSSCSEPPGVWESGKAIYR